MALNRQVFKTRTLTAVVFAAVMLLGLLWNKWSFLLLFSIIHFGCWWEYLRLSEKIYRAPLNNVTKLFFALTGFFFMFFIGYLDYSFDFIVKVSGVVFSVKWAALTLILICLFAFFVQNKSIEPKQKSFVVLGFIYLSLSLGLMVSLWQLGINWCKLTNYATTRLPIAVVTSIWVNDTMAYVVGSLIGKTPLTKISPKKTWEGTIGGVVLAVVVIALLFPLIYTGNINWPLPLFFGLIALIASIAGTFGDLFESKLKRMAGVKDSGSIMPGHGGFLDRFDSMLFAIPAVWLYVELVLK